MSRHADRLIQYSISAALVLAGKDSGAQSIIYTDVSPDVLIAAPSNGIAADGFDINQDGIDDLKLFVSQSSWGTSSPAGPYSCYKFDAAYGYLDGSTFGLNVGMVGSGFYADLLESGDDIGPASPWTYFGILKQRFSQFDDLDSCSSNISGNWVLGTNAFAGLRLSEPDGMHYGWIEIEMLDFGSYEVKAFAYHTEPGVPIKAGEFCPEPQNLTTDVTAIPGPVEVELSWNPVSMADGYLVYGRVAGSSSFVKFTEMDTSRSVTGLPPNSYEWTVLSICGAQKSGLASPESFVVPAVRREQTELESAYQQPLSISLSPNPVAPGQSLQLIVSREIVSFEIVNLTGQILYSEQLGSFSNSKLAATEGFKSSYELYVNTEGLPAGTYFLRVFAANNEHLSKGFVISDSF